MPIPLMQAIKVGTYVMRQKVKGRKRYPLVLMLEPLFRCNLECIGCGKIQKPNEILNKNLTPDECFQAARECGAPVVSIAGGEPLMHPQIVEIVEGLIKQKRYIYLCTNAIMLKNFLGKLPVSPFLTLSIHLDGLEEDHDRIVNRQGVFKVAVEAIRQAKEMGYRVSGNTTFFEGTTVEQAEKFLDCLNSLGVDGSTVASAFRYADAPDQEHFFGRKRTQEFFKELLGKNKKGRWDISHSPLYLEFLQGRRDYECTPWGNPNYSVLGWQKPCYLLDDGYAESFNELMDTTHWEDYGHKNNPKCADCTAHCGYEATAVEDATSSLKNMIVSARAAML
ncbi:MAG: hopanoid biosynthesis associated radical SAM protein HpnH [Nitrospinae bacterium]|jgi:hopanoid biosynthesis associated radical SAM protein HpnH|nr:hopanoid biosynthesis associated radical SAM protein HpnH [Nitrospinota bacterium]MBV51472.1 hopanoid biosynthesis associated radical SAM protein HpnH [Nitrospinota bacterium]MDP6336407.1 adenosyl-hopene transferase HpnH [Nitrospinaceae bacterium]|tara:strand:+ start:1955 stop:2962 length:1008 start_codon:yes stop_codon:yes gene_type:complete